MADGVYLDVFANSKQATKSIGQVGDALDDVGDDLDELARDGKKATDKLERSFKDLATQAQRSSKKVGDDFKKETTEGFHKGGETVAEFKAEALANLSEVTSSFTGSITSVTDLAQGTLGGLATMGGPIGIAFGAAAVGVGLVSTALGNNEQAQKDQAAAAAAWASAYIDAGSKVLSTSEQVAAAQAIITDPDQFKKAQESAKNWGVSVSTAILALTGNRQAIQDVTKAVDAYGDKIDAFNITNSDSVITLDDMIDRQRAAKDALRLLTGGLRDGQKAADVYSQILVNLAKTTAGATTKVDEFGDTVTSLPDGQTIYIDAETGQATSNVDAIAKKVYGLPKSAAVKVTADTAPFTRSMQKLADGSYRVKITVDGVTRYGQVIR